MHISLNMIRRTDDGVLISAPHGEVFLKRTGNGITAKYCSGPLVSGSTIQFAEKARRAALEQAISLQLPWSVNREGSISIRDQQQFYEQTFCSQSYALETLKRWFYPDAGRKPTGTRSP